MNIPLFADFLCSSSLSNGHLLVSLARGLDSLGGGRNTEVALPFEEVVQTLNDLIEYFQQPHSELEHEEKQMQLRSLIKRQDLFKEEVRCQRD